MTWLGLLLSTNSLRHPKYLICKADIVINDRVVIGTEQERIS